MEFTERPADLVASQPAGVEVPLRVVEVDTAGDVRPRPRPRCLALEVVQR